MNKTFDFQQESDAGSGSVRFLFEGICPCERDFTNNGCGLDVSRKIAEHRAQHSKSFP
jgi:hypothetical protein